MTLRMTAAWGSAAMLLAAMSVTSQPNRDQPNRDLSGTPTQPRTTQLGQPGLTSILNDMEGLWNVRITVNKDHWKMHKTSDRVPRQTTQPGGIEPGRNDGMQPGQGGDQGNQPGMSEPGLAQGLQMEGFSERKLILGDNVLEEHCYIPDMAKIIDGERQPGENPTMRIDNDTFEGLSLLSFSPEDGTYEIVFVDGKSGKMHYDTGSFDATMNRIVFEGKAHGADTTTTTPPARRDGTSPTPPAERRDGVGQQPGQDGMKHGMYGNVRVVLEVLGPNQHQVTMYKVDSSSPISTVPGEPPSREPADRNQPNNTPSQPGTEPWSPTTLASNIIYRATYTRAEGSQAARYRDLIEEAQVVTRGSEDEDTDR